MLLRPEGEGKGALAVAVEAFILMLPLPLRCAGPSRAGRAGRAGGQAGRARPWAAGRGAGCRLYFTGRSLFLREPACVPPVPCRTYQVMKLAIRSYTVRVAWPLTQFDSRLV